MNPDETKYLRFISSMDQDQFENWYERISNEEADYALNIMQKARAEIRTKMAEIFDDENVTKNLSAAKGVLGKYTLKGSL
jgi:hypothetical protein